MSASRFSFVRASSGFVLAGLFLLTGCQSCSTPEEKASAPVVTEEETADSQRDPASLATRYMDYAYRGALLSSDHPLNDSLAAITEGAVGAGRTVTVVDTFHVGAVRAAGDSGHAVRVRFPRSVQVESVSWTTSTPAVDAHSTLHIRQNKVHDAPHVVGWPAFQRHMTEVAPAAADSVLERMSTKLERPDEPGV